VQELGSANTYEVAFHDRTGSRPVSPALEPTRLQWSRVLDDTSEAQVSLDGDFFDPKTPIGSWDNELSIYRDGALVWQGPIQRIDYRRRDSDVVVTARDVTAWLAHRTIHHKLDFTASGQGPTDMAHIAEAIVRDAMEPDDPLILPYLTVAKCGHVGERKYEPDSAYAGDELRELARTGIDFTALGRRIVIAGETVQLARLPQLRDEHFISDINVIDDGLQAVTRAVVVGEGVSGTATAEGADKLLEVLVREDQIKDKMSAEIEAAAIVEVGHPNPLIVEIPEGAQLAADAPLAISDLIPGALVPVANSMTYRPVVTELRLTRLAVDFTAEEGESVKVTLAPIGMRMAEGKADAGT